MENWISLTLCGGRIRFEGRKFWGKCSIPNGAGVKAEAEEKLSYTGITDIRLVRACNKPICIIFPPGINSPLKVATNEVIHWMNLGCGCLAHDGYYSRCYGPGIKSLYLPLSYDSSGCLYFTLRQTFSNVILDIAENFQGAVKNQRNAIVWLLGNLIFTQLIC